METPDLDKRIEQLKKRGIICEKTIQEGKINLRIYHQPMVSIRSKIEFTNYEWGPMESEEVAIRALLECANDIKNDFTLLFMSVTNQYEQSFCR